MHQPVEIYEPPRKRARGKGRDPRSRKALALFATGMLSMTDAARQAGVTYQAVSLMIRRSGGAKPGRFSKGRLAARFAKANGVALSVAASESKCSYASARRGWLAEYPGEPLPKWSAK